ncbi:PREDICTED: uncharacterized protein LOC108563002 isoform X1 [Nicrophorus vespilloides]|uniref:Uncharacterized protein LOC108563002 isoform X1 n=1 Tax=Nicrophorus vespilloides TaxID=110193 RepID=A0ABM1MR21_NICVS|nr:PREDICTED: uncharacterized protein LOC108563002 isoform X1 [Nicrophorus vespilloides]
MGYDYKLVNSVDVKVKLISNLCCEVSDDDYVSILTDRGVFIFKLLAYKHNNLPIFSYSQTTIPLSTYVLSKNIGLTIEHLVPNLDKFDLFESVLRSDISVCIDNCTKPSSNVIASKWSYADAIGNQSVIATLNETGSLDLYTRIVKCNTNEVYYHLQNVTSIHIDIFKKDWSTDINENNAKHVLEDMKFRLDLHTPTAFIWSHSFNVNATKFCNLIVAQRNGTIIFWKFMHLSIESYKLAKVNFMHQHDTHLRDISAMHWIDSIDNSGFLVIGSISGNVMVYPVFQVSETTVKVSNGITLNSADNIKVDHIFSSVQENALFIYVIKQEVMVIYYLKDGSLKDSCFYYIGNLSVNGIQKQLDNSILICSQTGTFKEIIIGACEDDKIIVHWRHIYININWSNKKPVGFFSSRNNTIMTLITDYCKLNNFKEQKDKVNFYYYLNKGVNAVDLLFNNKTNSLKNYHDCLEAVRVDNLISKDLIFNKIPFELNYDNLSLLQLKTFLYISKTDDYIYQQLDNVPSDNMKDSNDIFTMIQIKLAIYFIQLILRQIDSDKKISEFKLQSMHILYSYLKEIVISDNIPKLDLGPNVIDEVLDIVSRCENISMQNSVVCLICGEDILGSFCVKTHFDNRCLISMMQIAIPKYMCPCCKHYVAEEAIIEFQVSLCPLCDHQLDVIMSDNKQKSVLSPFERK